MTLTDIEDNAISARMAVIFGSATFDRLFAGVRFDEVDGDSPGKPSLLFDGALSEATRETKKRQNFFVLS
jgi:hypothetical protein